MAIQIGTKVRLALFVGNGVADLDALLSADAILEYFGQLGTDFPSALTANGTFVGSLSAPQASAVTLRGLITQLDTASGGSDPEAVDDLGDAVLGAIGDTLGGLAGVVSALLDISGDLAPLSSAEVEAFANDLPRAIIDDAIVRRLEVGHPDLSALLALFGLVGRRRVLSTGPVDADDVTFGPLKAARFTNFSALTAVLGSPMGALEGALGWGGSSPDFNAILERVALVLELLGYASEIVSDGGDLELQAALFKIASNTSTTPPGLTATLGFEVPDGIDALLPVRPGLTIHGTTEGEFEKGFELVVVPPGRVEFEPPSGSFSASWSATLEQTPVAPATTLLLLGQTDGTRLEADSLELGLGLRFDSSGGTIVTEPELHAAIKGGNVVLDLSSGDGLLQALAGTGHAESHFDLAVSWSPSGGLRFDGGGALEINVPVHVTAGPVEMTGLKVAVSFPSDGGLPIAVAADLKGSFGPFALTVQAVGVDALVTFPGGTAGNLGPVNFELGFKLPTGIGVSIDSGGISGGGFLSHDEATGRYSGAIELRVFALGVKAFGVLDTKFPDGTEGMSFVIVIIAEFTPIQLGFGFTLNGVGGLLGVNRTVDVEALGLAVRAGSLEHLLFPVNVVQDAPSIINDLATVFPATRDHQLFGPMGKLGWGTPTLITADIGIVIEFPGPRLAVLGVVHMQLPSAEFAILSLNLAVAGVLDFPAGKFAIDASLYDSYVAGFSLSGDMSYRMELGSKPTFLLSVGGFNPAFHPPARFPTLRRVSADLGLNGNPSLTASGYFALTSNTVQFGASMQLRASGFGIRLRGGWALDVMFVFSPFSFTASISAGVHIDFHGFGFGINLHGSLSGPTPYHFNGRACVEICIWEACLPIDIVFGHREPASLPEMDPWFGTASQPDIDPRISVLGLESAIQDPRSWSGEPPPEGYSIVSLSAAASADRTPIDPVGSATLRQKVCPLKHELQRFGQYRPIGHTSFTVTSVDVGTQLGTTFDDVEDDFAPAQFLSMSNAQKLSSDSYDKMIGGVRLSPNTVKTGPSTNQTLFYETVFITATGQRVPEEDGDPKYAPTDVELRAMLKRSSAGRAGIRRVGAQKYMLAGRPKLLTLDTPTFVVADACSMAQNVDITPSETTRTLALLRLRKYEQEHPADKNRYRVVPVYLAA